MTVILLRHGRSTANTSGVLAGRSPGIDLDERGQEQARGVAERLADLPIRAIVRSPLQRCEQTIAPLVAATGLTPIVDDGIVEVDYGSWTGRKISELFGEPLWSTVQRTPSAATFPEGESLSAMQTRSVRAIRERDAQLAFEHGRDVLWLACTHGDVIKSLVADALGIHLDGFQRIIADPASVSVLRYSGATPFAVHVNHTGSDLASLKNVGARPDEAAIGGGSG